MANNRIDFQSGLKKAVIPKLSELGYEKFRLSEKWRGAPVTFFQKYLFDDFYGYIMFQIQPWMPKAEGLEPMPRTFCVYLVRNSGEEPDPIPRKYAYYIYMPLSYLLWNNYGIQTYESMYHQWEYKTKEDLIDQLTLVTDDLVTYGIPYLEDMNSKNPF